MPRRSTSRAMTIVATALIAPIEGQTERAIAFNPPGLAADGYDIPRDQRGGKRPGPARTEPRPHAVESKHDLGTRRIVQSGADSRTIRLQLGEPRPPIFARPRTGQVMRIQPQREACDAGRCHWHPSSAEKLLVLQGSGSRLIRKKPARPPRHARSMNWPTASEHAAESCHAGVHRSVLHGGPMRTLTAGASRPSS